MHALFRERDAALTYAIVFICRRVGAKCAHGRASVWETGAMDVITTYLKVFFRKRDQCRLLASKLKEKPHFKNVWFLFLQCRTSAT